jgi:hypothetical protein
MKRRILILICAVVVLSGMIYSQASITVTSPKGGEKWLLGSNHDITWEASGTTGKFKITLWKDDVKIGQVASGVSASANSIPWTVGTYEGGIVKAGSGYKIKIKEKNSPTAGISENPFSILPRPKKLAKLPKPDLRLRVSVVPNAPKHESLIMLIVHNDGNAPLLINIKLKYTVYLYGETGYNFVFTSGDFYNYGLTGIKPGERFTIAKTFYFHKAGKWKMIGYVDSDNRQDESDENNNSHFVEFEVSE